MQAQARRQQVNTQQTAITHSQSCEAVQTLVTAALGCITWLRDLLPSDNFSKSYFTTSDDSFAYKSMEATDTPSRPKRNFNSFQIMTMARGYTPEADTILDYIDRGLFDALQKQYLKTFVFGIYIDPKDPNNMVEAYTFHFKYYRIPGTDISVPLMTVGDDITQRNGGWEDPTAENVKRGQAPTFKDVKRSVKTLLKALIQHTTSMDELPKARWATIKITYTDETPEDYEPPHFKAGDYEKDKWYFSTHDMDEIPEHLAVGSLKTGHHSVNINITSIAAFLPSNNHRDDETFAGLSSHRPNVPPPSAQEDVEIRASQARVQAEDAEKRNAIWSEPNIEISDADGEYEDDPDYVKSVDVSCVGFPVPIGIRDENGEIRPVDANEVRYDGRSEMTPTSLRDMNKGDDTQSLAETQPLDSECQLHPVTDTPDRYRPTSSLPPSSPMSEATDLGRDPTDDLDTQMIKSLVIRCDSIIERQSPQDTEMLDLETQLPESIDSFNSFQPGMDRDTIEVDACCPPSSTPQTLKLRSSLKDRVNVPNQTESNEVMNCECACLNEDESMLCEGKCARWYHLWCMGFHNGKDSRLPKRFVCLDCCLRADVSWELIKSNLYPAIMAKLKEISTFRRAIKVSETLSSMTIVEFTEAMGCESTMAPQLIKQLEDENFLVNINNPADTRGRGRGRGGGKKRGRQPRQRYSFNVAATKSEPYRSYFLVDPLTDPKIIGSDLKSMLKFGPSVNVNVTHTNPTTPKSMYCLPEQDSIADAPTQDETQVLISPGQGRKRTLDEDFPSPPSRPKKKPKVSLAIGVDLAE